MEWCRTVTDERAVSPVLAYILTLSVTALVVGGLLMATGSFVTDQRHQTAESELQVVGQQLSADVAATDRLNRTDGNTNSSIRRNVPDRTVGAQYQISLQNDSAGPTEPYLELTASELDASVQVGVSVQGSVANSTASGGTVVVGYDEDSRLVIRND